MRIRFSAIVFFCALCSVVSAQDFVDLGLSVKWSTSNTGITADRPVGWYYRWPDAMELKTADGSRMASKAEWDELRRYCTWKWAEQDGIAGYLVTSKIKGYTDKSIFLPAAGFRFGTSVYIDGRGLYWSSSYGSVADNAYYMQFGSDSLNPADDFKRSYGFFVRLVRSVE